MARGEYEGKAGLTPYFNKKMHRRRTLNINANTRWVTIGAMFLLWKIFWGIKSFLFDTCPYGLLGYGQSVHKYYAEHGQDMLVRTELLAYKDDGIFIEAGAYDGMSGSTMAFFEKGLAYTGVCIEANRDAMASIRRHRTCLPVNGLLCANTDKDVIFTQFAKPYDAYSGIFELMPPYRQEDLRNAITSNVTEVAAQYKMRCLSMKDLLDLVGTNEIDVLSLDINGGEYVALTTLTSDILIDVILVSGNDPRVYPLLKKKKYFLFQIVGYDQIYVRKHSDAHKYLKKRAACWR